MVGDLCFIKVEGSVVFVTLGLNRFGQVRPPPGPYMIS